MIYLTPLLGGIIIGVAAMLMWYGLGRIMGMSSITSGVLWQQAAERQWRVVFIVAVIIGALIASKLLGVDSFTPIKAGWIWPIAAGLLVGFGTGIGSGCTSGHGICGIGRFSARSIIATCVFMASGIATVFFVRAIGA
ncbi:YeeE/YedE thiosulfate transporter family protein [uncultured Umboniibacter sp.]|uniref:YeeE/YedE family protein n=1 Tax=uncultured Umboniibacter sp. TaxID=1798917 RepID=UPI0026310C5E|nr:YeeE/YedE thiosulfate transporter family protein [uncultured Umboniibacter sp.]